MSKILLHKKSHQSWEEGIVICLQLTSFHPSEPEFVWELLDIRETAFSGVLSVLFDDWQHHGVRTEGAILVRRKRRFDVVFRFFF